MFTADRLEQTPLMDQVLLQLSQSPTPIGQAEVRGRLFGDLSDGIQLGYCDARWSTSMLKAFTKGQTGTGKAMQVGVDGVDVHG
jgi:hypothetical protein